jgi:hypothetical protein
MDNSPLYREKPWAEPRFKGNRTSYYLQVMLELSAVSLRQASCFFNLAASAKLISGTEDAPTVLRSARACASCGVSCAARTGVTNGVEFAGL